MSGRRCDACGRFCARLHDVWDPVAPQVAREVCDDCRVAAGSAASEEER